MLVVRVGGGVKDACGRRQLQQGLVETGCTSVELYRLEDRIRRSEKHTVEPISQLGLGRCGQAHPARKESQGQTTRESDAIHSVSS